VGLSYRNGPRCPSVCMSVSHRQISPKLSEAEVQLLLNPNRKLGVGDSESAIRFATGSMALTQAHGVHCGTPRRACGHSDGGNYPLAQPFLASSGLQKRATCNTGTVAKLCHMSELFYCTCLLGMHRISGRISTAGSDFLQSRNRLRITKRG